MHDSYTGNETEIFGVVGFGKNKKICLFFCNWTGSLHARTHIAYNYINP
ncbi:MAG: hypothetical protein K0Q87_4589 [Neobacillus sp.]|nr:hypothetical protein [Neobacillus sp.]